MLSHKRVVDFHIDICLVDIISVVIHSDIIADAVILLLI